MKKFTAYITLAALLAAGCQQEEVSIPSDDTVRFTAGIESMATKASSDEDRMEGIPTNMDGFTLDYSSAYGIGMEAIETKGAQINTTGSQKSLNGYASAISKFNVWAYNGDNSAFITNEIAQLQEDIWDTNVGHPWKTEDTKTFYAYANTPASGTSVSCSTSGLQMTVSAIPAKASDQKDVLVARYKSGAPEKIVNVPLSFQHAMTAVVFKKGTVEGTFNIKSVTLSGVYSSAKAAFDSSVAWSDKTGSATVTGTVDDAFLLIPQGLAAQNVTATIVFNNGTKDVTIQTVLNTGSWEVGKTNTYTINYTVPNLSVAVDYTNSGTAISGISITKTGIKAYVRAAIVCHMVDGEGLVHSTPEGTMSGFNSTDWEKGTDGFYYYKNPVSAARDADGTAIANQTTALNSLCTGYTLPTESGLTCKFHIAVQAVQYDPSKTCQQAFN